MGFLKPPRLRKGDLIGLVSPASTPQFADKISGAVRYFEAQGYRVTLGEHVAKAYGYLAGRDEERAADFNGMLRDPQVKAVFALRGGYGTPRILPLIDYRALRTNPKIVGGYSDITALQLAILKKSGLVTFSCPMPGVEFWKNPDPFTEEHFWNVLTSPRFRSLNNPPREEFELARKGNADGVIMPANLALLVSQMGTPFLPNLRRSIAVIEEIDEYPYRVDRMFVQLRNGGILQKLAGLVLGQFTNCAPPAERPSLTIAEVLEQAVQWTNCPALARSAYGHVPRKPTIPMGVLGRIRAGRGKPRLEMTEGAVV